MSVAIITGASSGIGEAVAAELHRRGWKVGLIARRQDRLTAQAAALGSGAAFAVADVTDGAALGAAIADLETRLGPCDLLLANAGIGSSRSARRFDAAETLKIMAVNCAGVVHAFAAVLPGMLERGRGTLAATSSIAAVRGLPDSGPYSASKAYVSTLLESMRVDLRGTGVGVSTIHPGFVVSELTDKNRFTMPFLLETSHAARIIVDGLSRGRRTIDFPWQMVWLRQLVRLLPDWLYDRVATWARPRRKSSRS